MRTCYIVAYDIADPKRLQRVHRTMRGYGDPLQYSVFRCILSPSERILDIIANNPTDQKVVELSSSQHYSLGENSMYGSGFLPQGVEDGVFLPSSPRASKAFPC